MPEETHTCPQHSGVVSQQTIVVWLLGILIVMIGSSSGYMIVSIAEIQKQVSVIPIQLKQLAERDTELKTEIREIDTRLKVVEKNALK